MANSSPRPVELADVGREAAAPEQAELELALEFKEMLRELAADLAGTATGPSVDGLAQAVHDEIAAIGAQLQSELARDLEQVRSEQAMLRKQLQEQSEAFQAAVASQITGILESGLTDAKTSLSDEVRQHMAPVVKQLSSLTELEGSLRDGIAATGEAADKASQTMAERVEDLARTGDALKKSLSSTASQLSEKCVDLRQAVASALPALDATARGVQAGQDSLKGMLHTYNETLERSLAALETKFSGLLAASLERAAQRQAELDTRVRATAERTEEAVLDLMQGNEAHHQAMVEGTAASLSQLEVFNQSFRQTSAALKGLLFLGAGALVGLVFVSYLLLTRG